MGAEGQSVHLGQPRSSGAQAQSALWPALEPRGAIRTQREDAERVPHGDHTGQSVHVSDLHAQARNAEARH